MELLHVVGDMYERGIKVDVLYVMEALEYERKEIASNKEKFRTETGREYQDSPKLFKEIFDLRGEEYGRTEKVIPRSRLKYLRLLTRQQQISLILYGITKSEKEHTGHRSYTSLTPKEYLELAQVNQIPQRGALVIALQIYRTYRKTTTDSTKYEDLFVHGTGMLLFP